MFQRTVSCLVALVVLLSFVFLNLDGAAPHLLRFPMKSYNPNRPSFSSFELLPQRPSIPGAIPSWMHGWPFLGLYRTPIIPAGFKGGYLPSSFSGPIQVTSRWPFDMSPWDHVSYLALGIDVLIAIGVTCHAFWLSGVVMRKRFRISISMLLVVTLLAACLLSLRSYLLKPHDSLQAVSLVVVSAFSFSALSTVAHCLIHRPIKKLSKRSQPIQAETINKSI